ncbi:MAG TPA: ATP phosphoribosyltransferase [Polyangia bacterium]|jgi:ATP phosphoribosyltransferase|nr:ATP phosphoribosyltransferase [Polyangia bacterium]
MSNAVSNGKDGRAEDAGQNTGTPAAEPLRLALPKGRILDEAVVLFGRAGLDLGVVRTNARRLVHEVPRADGEAPLIVYVVRDVDVPTYVEYGAADLGIAGRDVLEEQGRDLYEPLDLNIGHCRLAVAEPIDRPVDEAGQLHLRVATKFPRLTRRHLEQKGVVADIIKLYGSVELGPLTGLADRVVDLVSTGETLRQHRLREVETILEVTARLVVNRAALKLKRHAIDALIERLRAAVVRER